MITINLQYLAVIPGGLAVIAAIVAVLAFISVFRSREIEFMISVHYLVTSVTAGVVLSGLAWLIWQAFRA